MEGNYIQPEVQILAKIPVFDLFFQVLVGGGYDPHIHLIDPAGTHLLDLALLQDTEDLCLRLEAHVANLVQENGPVVRQFEFAGLLLRCPGKSALDMAEQFALDQLLGNGGAVDLDKGILAAQALGMHGPGDELLPGPALSVDHDGGIGGGDFLDLLPEDFHGGMIPDQPVFLLRLLPQVAAFARQPVLAEGVADAEQDSFPMQGLLKKIKGTQFGGLHSRMYRAVAGDHDHFRKIGALLQLGQDLHAIQTGQFDVQQHQVEPHCLIDDLERFLPVCGLQDGIAVIFEDHPQGLSDVFFVIHDQDLFFALFAHNQNDSTPLQKLQSCQPPPLCSHAPFSTQRFQRIRWLENIRSFV
ncbi:MAG: hypothetical protein WBB73_03345 [Candidatus Aminicenantaceae bacterium]